MTRNLKALGLALAAVFAMSAWIVSAASAHTPATFTGTKGATVRGAETVANVFNVTGLETTCKNVEFHGSVAAAVSETQTINPTYSECTAESIIGTISVTVTGFGATGCDYRVRADGKADLECAAGKEVTVDAGPCTVHVPAQTGLGTLTFTTELKRHSDEKTLSHDLLVHVVLTGITANHTDGIGCPFNGSAEGVVGTLTGTTTVWLEDINGTPVPLTWDATVA